MDPNMIDTSKNCNIQTGCLSILQESSLVGTGQRPALLFKMQNNINIGYYQMNNN